MDQVLLDRGGGESVVLATFRDVDGVWLCSKEVHTKLGSRFSTTTWHCHTHGGEHTS